MSVIDLGKNLSESGFRLEEVSSKQLLVEAIEGMGEAIQYKEKGVGAILVGERVYRAMVERLEEWTPDGNVFPYEPDVFFRGIRVYVYKSEEERLSLKWGLCERGKKVLEVVE